MSPANELPQHPDGGVGSKALPPILGGGFGGCLGLSVQSPTSSNILNPKQGLQNFKIRTSVNPSCFEYPTYGIAQAHSEDGPANAFEAKIRKNTIERLTSQ